MKTNIIIILLLFFSNTYSQHLRSFILSDLNNQQANIQIDKWIKRGYNLTQICGYGYGFDDSYTILFNKPINNLAKENQVILNRLDNTTLNPELNKYRNLGYIPTCVSSFLVKGFDGPEEVHHAIILVKSSNTDYFSFQNLSETEFQNNNINLTNKGYYVSDISTYTKNNVNYYSVMFSKFNLPYSLITYTNQSFSELKNNDSKLQKDGYGMYQFAINNMGKYTACWMKLNLLSFNIYEKSNLEYNKFNIQNGFNNILPKRISAMNTDIGNKIFGGIYIQFDNYKDQVGCVSLNKLKNSIKSQLDYKCAGYNFSVYYDGIHEGSLVGGYSKMAIDGNQTDMTIFDKIHIASMSKTITAVTTLKLLSDLNLTVDEKIYMYLPPNWLLGPNIKEITFKQLMRHETGFRDIPGVDCTGPVLFQNNSGYCTLPENSNYEFLKCKILNGINTNDINKYQYNNLNFQLLRVIIPKLAGFNHATANNDDFTNAKYLEIVKGVINNDSLSCNNQTLYHYSYPLQNNIHGMTFGNFQYGMGAFGLYMSSIEYGNFLNNLFNKDILNDYWLNQFTNLNLGCFDEYINNNTKVLSHNGSWTISWGWNNVNCKGVSNSIWYRTPDGLIMVLEINSELPIFINEVLKNAYNAACNATSTSTSPFVKDEITIYPNPSSDILNIKSDLLDINQLTYEISNIQGQIIAPLEPINKDGKINIANLSSGVFILKLYTKDNDFVKKFIKIN
jgi:hypothetical protein